MNRSESIGKLTEALSAAQGKIKGAIKGSDNPFFNSKYADLAAVWEAVREPLSAAGLAVMQFATDHIDEFTPGHPKQPRRIQVETLLSHSSGEWVSSTISVEPAKQDAQGYAAAVTYLRRCALSAIVGVAQEDDDGNEASGNKPSASGLGRGLVKPGKEANRGHGNEGMAADESSKPQPESQPKAEVDLTLTVEDVKPGKSKGSGNPFRKLTAHADGAPARTYYCFDAELFIGIDALTIPSVVTFVIEDDEKYPKITGIKAVA